MGLSYSKQLPPPFEEFQLIFGEFHGGSISIGFATHRCGCRFEGLAHGFEPMLDEELFLLGEQLVGLAEDGAERGGHLQGDEQEDGAPDDERATLARITRPAVSRVRSTMTSPSKPWATAAGG